MDRTLRAQIAAHTSWARTPDRTARTAAARAALLAKFESEVDPDGTLPPAERAKRAENARRAYYLRLAAKSASSRRQRAAERNTLAVEAELDAIAAEGGGAR
ncbi:hypothetical protein [Jannaschia sp. R86511]|uniref:hypothetical protein n=1 Tax=Jannaschia sp. R86511 TaxID=3093853 RepID=UPI0036D27C00